jgi:hypothetical protein
MYPRLLLALLLVSAPVAAQQLSATERRIVATVDSAVPPALDLLKRTVNINSGTHNLLACGVSPTPVA